MRITTAILIAAFTAIAMPLASSAHAGDQDAAFATQRAVAGIVTQVDPALLTISPIQGGHKECITGRLDSARTHVFIDGRPARPTDIKITQSVKGELALDDVWTVVRIDTTR